MREKTPLNLISLFLKGFLCHHFFFDGPLLLIASKSFASDFLITPFMVSQSRFIFHGQESLVSPLSHRLRSFFNHVQIRRLQFAV